MNTIPQRIRPALTAGSITGKHPKPALDCRSVLSYGMTIPQYHEPSQPAMTFPHEPPAPKAAPPISSKAPVREMKLPRLEYPAIRGQKVTLQPQSSLLKIGFGWNFQGHPCDADISAFLLTNDRRVPADEWFVFYSQPESPDGSVLLQSGMPSDRQTFTFALSLLDSRITRIAFVLTIDGALENHLHFGLLKNVYMRVLDGETNHELVSYCPEELSSSITSMTIGELYLHNGQWKFNPVGNGVHQDLAGQCAVYGVEIG